MSAPAATRPAPIFGRGLRGVKTYSETVRGLAAEYLALGALIKRESPVTPACYHPRIRELLGLGEKIERLSGERLADLMPALGHWPLK